MAAKGSHRSANLLVAEQLITNAKALENAMDSHLVTWWGPIQQPADQYIKRAVEHRVKQRPRRRRLSVILQTNGGYIETAERMADTFRKHYRWVSFIVPNYAMSAGTVLVMSGDEIWMNYFSTLGPIDPQVERRDGRDGFIPALGYLAKYEELIEKSRVGALTSAEATYLVQNFDPGELFSYSQAKKLSVRLLKTWLVKYKFKNWKRTKTHRRVVTMKMKKDRAAEIADSLCDTETWLSHGRGISMNVLRRKLNLKIRDIEEKPDVHKAAEDYYELLENYLVTIKANGVLHAGDMLVPIG